MIIGKAIILIISHLISIPPGPHILSDVLLTTQIVGEENPSNNFEFGVDPSLDPELALVIQFFINN